MIAVVFLSPSENADLPSKLHVALISSLAVLAALPSMFSQHTQNVFTNQLSKYRVQNSAKMPEFFLWCVFKKATFQHLRFFIS